MLLVTVGAGLPLLAARPASANPRPLPFTYPYGTLAEGSLEVELYSDVNPLREPSDPANPAAGNIWVPQYLLQNEFEYGLTDHLELGFYQVFGSNPLPGGDNEVYFDGLKWRVRGRLAEAGEWPIDVSLYLELETMHDETALEGKVNLEKDFGALRWQTNLWSELAYERPYDRTDQGRKLVYIVNPTTGFVYQVTPVFQPGIEAWARGQIVPTGATDQDHENSRVHYFLGPTAHFNFGKLWLSLGIYAHLNGTDTPAPGDAYGPLWFRSVIGLEL
jgi:hypothetical protein